MTTDRFPLHDETTAPEAARDALAATRKNFGMIPNLERVMAGAPALLAAYSGAWDLFDETSLTPAERQIVYQTANVENECDYCVPWHSLLAKKAGLAPAEVEALRTGTPLSDPRHEALRAFARRLIHSRGKVLEADLEAFLGVGYTAQQALEVVLGLAIKTMSNFTNSIAGTPLDTAVRPLAWSKPRIAMRAAPGEDAA
ncbi:MAG: carboxymuconolactone decarboxylase family protein [Pseudomonadota bacterium]